MAVKYHPDKQPNDEKKKEASLKFQELTTAYEVLNDPVKRAKCNDEQDTQATCQRRRPVVLLDHNLHNNQHHHNHNEPIVVGSG